MAIIDRIALSEGFSGRVIKDPGRGWDIGFGRSLTYNPLSAEEKKYVQYNADGSMSISRAGAEQLLKNDVNKMMKDMDRRIPWWRTLDDERQFVLLDMAYTLGVGGLCRQKTILNAMKVHNYEAAAEAMRNSKWYRQVGNRGARDYLLLKTGVYNKNVTQKTVGRYASGNVQSAPAPAASSSQASFAERAWNTVKGVGKSLKSVVSSEINKVGNKVKATGNKLKKQTKTATNKPVRETAKKDSAKAEKTKQQTLNANEQQTKKVIEERIKALKSDIDAKKASETLYKKHGKKAVDELDKAMKKKDKVTAVKTLIKDAESKKKTKAKSVGKTKAKTTTKPKTKTKTNKSSKKSTSKQQVNIAKAKKSQGR